MNNQGNLTLLTCHAKRTTLPVISVMSDIITCRPDLRHKKNPTNADVLEQLEDIYRLAARDYPYEAPAEVDDNLLFRLGSIAATAKKAISDYHEQHQ